MEESNKNKYTLEKKLLHGLQYLFHHTWLFYILIVLVLLIAVALRVHQAGISLFPKQTNISLNNPHYQAGMSFWEELDYTHAEEQFLLALKETQEAKGNSALETAEIMQKLGALYLEMDKLDECYDYLNSAYVTFQKELGPNDGMTIISRCQIYLYDVNTGNVERGLAGLTDAYDVSKNMSDKVQIATMLAQSHTKLGNYEEAGQYYQQLLRLYEEANFPGIYSAVTWNDYAVMLLDQGKPQDALAALEQAELRWTQSATSATHELANIYSNKAQVYVYLNRPQEAIIYIDKSLDIRKELGNDESIYVANTYLTAADAYSILGMDNECLDALETALQTALSARGENNLVTGTIYRSLGSFYSTQHNMDLAIEYHLKALEIQKNLLGEKDNVTAVTYRTLCDDYNTTGDYVKSIEYGLKSIEVYELLHETDNPLTASAYLQIAWPYMNSGKYESALYYAKLGTDICNRYLEKNDYTLCWAHQTLGYAYSNLGQYPDAISHLKTALELYQNVPNMDCSKEMATTYDYLGTAYLKSSDYSNALDAYQSELSIASQLSESDRAAFSGVYNSLGFTFYQLHEYDSALEYYGKAEKFYQAEIAAYGSESSKDFYRNLASVYNNIAAVYEDQGIYDLAVQYELKTYQILKSCSINYREEPKIAARLERLYQQINPHIPFEMWLETAGG